MRSFRATPDVTVLSDHAEVPGLGFLPVNAFVLHAAKPCERPLPLNRIRLVNTGDTLDVGDRTLTAFRPPLFDNPATVACYEDKNGACFSSDCFGAPLASADLATGDDTGAGPEEDLRAGQLLWASLDSPWVHNVDEAKFGQTVDSIRTLGPSAIFSTHLPPAIGRTKQLVETLLLAPTVQPFVGPNQQALEYLLSQFEPAAT